VSVRLFQFLTLTYPPPRDLYPLSLHDALPISHPLPGLHDQVAPIARHSRVATAQIHLRIRAGRRGARMLVHRGDGQLIEQLHRRSEEHTSELQSRENLVCRLLLEKKNI